MTTTTNPFLNADLNSLFDPATYMNAFQVPGVDSAKLAESQRKTIEAITEAQRTALNGAQQVMQRQMDIARELPQAQTQAAERIGKADSAEAGIAAQTEIAKTAYETSVRNLRELAELSANVQQKTFNLLNTRLTESFDELRDSVKTAA